MVNLFSLITFKSIRLFLLGAIASFALLSGISSADAGGPIEVKDPQWVHLNGQRFYVPGTCQQSAEKLKHLFYLYDTASYSNSSSSAKKIHSQIQELLAQSQPGDECYSWMYGAEVLFSLNLYNRRSNVRAESLVVLATSLYQRGRFQPLTPALRESWGGEWLKANHIMGAYECQSTVIYFDPTIRPYDLGGVISHEIEHLMRDKYTFFNGDTFSESQIPAALLIDELLSSLHAGYLQISFQRDEMRKNGKVSRAKIDFDWNGFSFQKTRAFRLRDDLDFYKPGGHLYRLWAKNARNDVIKKGMLFSEFFNVALYPEFADDYRKHWAPLFKMVRDAYFDRGGPTEKQVGELLESWVQRYPELVSPLGSLMRKASDDTRAGSKTAWDNFWSTFNYRIDTVSTGCLVMKKAIIEGRSAGYIGSKLGSSPSNGGEGTRPTQGGEGTRPTQGGEGTRPTQGGEGTRPGVPLTPCLYPSEAL